MSTSSSASWTRCTPTSPRPSAARSTGATPRLCWPTRTRCQRTQLEAHAAPGATADQRETAELELERALFTLSFTVREQIKAPQPLPRKQLGLAPEPERKGPQPTTAAPKARGKAPEVLGKLV